MQQRTQEFALITQNVDGLQEGAGSRDVLRLHGSIWTLRCLLCGMETEDRRTPLPELPPSCACGGMLRPAVVWFGESLPSYVWSAAEQAAGRCDVFLIAGTSGTVYPAASLATIAVSARARIIEINPEETPLSSEAHISLRGPAGKLLPQLLAG